MTRQKGYDLRETKKGLSVQTLCCEPVFLACKYRKDAIPQQGKEDGKNSETSEILLLLPRACAMEDLSHHHHLEDKYGNKLPLILETGNLSLRAVQSSPVPP